MTLASKAYSRGADDLLNPATGKVLGAEEEHCKQIAAMAEPSRNTAVPGGNDDPPSKQQGVAEVRN